MEEKLESPAIRQLYRLLRGTIAYSGLFFVIIFISFVITASASVPASVTSVDLPECGDHWIQKRAMLRKIIVADRSLVGLNLNLRNEALVSKGYSPQYIDLARQLQSTIDRRSAELHQVGMALKKGLISLEPLGFGILLKDKVIPQILALTPLIRSKSERLMKTVRALRKVLDKVNQDSEISNDTQVEVKSVLEDIFRIARNPFISTRDLYLYDKEWDGDNYDAYLLRSERSQCRKAWTVLVYMETDDLLLPYAYWDLYEMEAGYKSKGTPLAGSTYRSDWLVRFHHDAAENASGEIAGDLGSHRLHIFQSDVELDKDVNSDTFGNYSLDQISSPRISNVKMNSELESQCDPLADDSAIRLCRFLLWGGTQYPANHTMVIVWGHGEGFQLGYGEGSKLPTPLLAKTLKVATDHFEKPFDIYASDSCLMQMLEVAYEISETSNYIVGSAQIQSFVGLPYRRMEYILNTRRFPDGKNAFKINGEIDEAFLLAKAIPQLMESSLYQGTGAVQGTQRFASESTLRTYTMGTIGTHALRYEFMPRATEFSEAMVEYLASNPFYGLGIQNIFEKGVMNYADEGWDLASFLGVLNNSLRERTSEASLALKQATRNLDDALDKTVLRFHAGKDYDKVRPQGFTAVSLWLPDSFKSYEMKIESYENHSSFYGYKNQITGDLTWGNWLKALWDSAPGM